MEIRSFYFSTLILSLIIVTSCCENAVEAPDELEMLKEKLLGEWYETAPRDSTSNLIAIFYENDTLLVDEKWDSNLPDEKYIYQVISKDSIMVFRDSISTTFHSVIFHTRDSITISKFANISLVWGYIDISLYKIK
jgi:hypothetical protein